MARTRVSGMRCCVAFFEQQAYRLSLCVIQIQRNTRDLDVRECRDTTFNLATELDWQHQLAVASICGEDWVGGQITFFDPPFLLRLPSLPFPST